jgi:hypothetical protein
MWGCNGKHCSDAGLKAMGLFGTFSGFVLRPLGGPGLPYFQSSYPCLFLLEQPRDSLAHPPCLP